MRFNNTILRKTLKRPELPAFFIYVVEERVIRLPVIRRDRRHLASLNLTLPTGSQHTAIYRLVKTIWIH